MPLLHIALQNGFAGEPVVIRCQGAEIFHRPEVKTRRQIGLADTVEERLPAGPVTLSIGLPQRGLEHTVELQLGEDTFVAVSVSAQGQLVHRISSEPFGYV